jgi:hypothetical protein
VCGKATLLVVSIRGQAFCRSKRRIKNLEPSPNANKRHQKCSKMTTTSLSWTQSIVLPSTSSVRSAGRRQLVLVSLFVAWVVGVLSCCYPQPHYDEGDGRVHSSKKQGPQEGGEVPNAHVGKHELKVLLALIG